MILFKYILIGVLIVPIIALGAYLLNNLLDLVLAKGKKNTK